MNSELNSRARKDIIKRLNKDARASRRARRIHAVKDAVQRAQSTAENTLNWIYKQEQHLIDSAYQLDEQHPVATGVSRSTVLAAVGLYFLAEGFPNIAIPLFFLSGVNAYHTRRRIHKQ